MSPVQDMNQAQGGPSPGGQVLNAVKFVADTAILPGASQLVEGAVLPGVLYGLVGWLSRAFLGPVGWIAIGLDSYSMSASQKHLWEHILPSAAPKVGAAGYTTSPERQA